MAIRASFCMPFSSEEKKINTWKHTQRRNPMKRTLLSLVLLIGFSSNAPESHGQGAFESYGRGNFQKAWEELQDEFSARPVLQITYRGLESSIKIAGDVYEQTGAISFADYHDLLKQMLNQDSKWVLSFDLSTFVEYSEEIHSKKLSDESQWNLEIDRVRAAGRGLYDKDRRARLFALDTFFSRKWYEERANVAEDKRNLRWLFFAGKAQFMISSLNGQFLNAYVVHCEAQRGMQCDFTEEARSLLELWADLQPNADVVAEAQRRTEPQRQAEIAADADPVRPPGRVFRDCPSCPELVVIPGGRFRMGSTDEYDGAQPVHDVTVASFALGRYEVTFEEFLRFRVASGWPYPDRNEEEWGWPGGPVKHVSWADVQAYLAWLSAETGKRYRLPSEAEWEYAARAGTTTVYSWGNEIGDNRANCDGCGSRWDDEQTAPVGSFGANAWGLHDMHGNVSEFVEDCWHENYTGAPSDGTAWTSGGDCGSLILRGGSFYDLPRYLRSTFRGGAITPDVRGAANIGFRVARTLTP